MSERYKEFGSVLGDPALVVSGTLAILFGVGSVKATDPVVEASLAILLGIFAGIAGQTWSRQYFEQEGHRTLKEKGKSATRSLSHIHQIIKAIETRLESYVTMGDDGEAKDEIEVGVEEAVEKCRLTRRATLNSIEDWKDILPEADIARQLGLVNELKTRISELENQLSHLEKERDEAQKESKEERKARKETQTELREAKKQLREKERELRTSPISSLTLESGLSEPTDRSLRIFDRRSCVRCGKVYKETESDWGTSMRCPDCRE